MADELPDDSAVFGVRAIILRIAFWKSDHQEISKQQTYFVFIKILIY